MGDLRECWEKIYKDYGNTSEVEQFESVELVDKYRLFWKPDRVKIILLAESHVYTEPEETQITFEIPKKYSLEGYPKNYVRFVYCLAYGEKQLTQNSNHPKGDGTPQFWKLFYSCINRVNSNSDFSPLMKTNLMKTNSYDDRISRKIELLKSLKEKGVWLVDASIVALYKPGNRDPKTEPHKIKNMKGILKTSWNCYTRYVVEQSKPKCVICIGNDVDSCIDLGSEFKGHYEAIFQPNSHLRSEEHIANYQRCFDICSRLLV
jgi:hypothetical protein